MAIDPAIPDMLRGDDTRIRQIIFNLVDNALKFTPEGGISVRCSLASDTDDGKAVILLTVTDTGIGIPEEKQGMLFNAFTQVDSFFTKKFAGTGLGLSIVKRLVAMMNGSILLESEPGKGTAISCTLVLETLAPSEKNTAAPRAADKPDKRPLDILVAEDDAVGRFALRSFLLRGGHRAVCVQDGRRPWKPCRPIPSTACSRTYRCPI